MAGELLVICHRCTSARTPTTTSRQLQADTKYPSHVLFPHWSRTNVIGDSLHVSWMCTSIQLRQFNDWHTCYRVCIRQQCAENKCEVKQTKPTQHEKVKGGKVNYHLGDLQVSAKMEAVCETIAWSSTFQHWFVLSLCLNCHGQAKELTIIPKEISACDKLTFVTTSSQS